MILGLVKVHVRVIEGIRLRVPSSGPSFSWGFPKLGYLIGFRV